jgi:hypothetical protein
MNCDGHGITRILAADSEPIRNLQCSCAMTAMTATAAMRAMSTALRNIGMHYEVMCMAKHEIPTDLLVDAAYSGPIRSL